MIGVTTYFDAGKLRMHAFLPKNGNLYVTSWDGTQWKWVNQGKPADTTVDETPPYTPGVISYVDTASKRTLIYAFVLGANGNLYVNYWDGFKWQWANQGKPAATKLHSAPRAITYLELPNKHWIYAFAGGEDGNLYANYWDGTKWQWVKLPKSGEAAGVTWNTDPVSAKRRIYVFGLLGIPNIASELDLNEWDGSKWQGTTQPNNPFNSLALLDHPSVISYAQAGTLRVYAFMATTGGELLVHYWNGTKWQWAQQGKPPGVNVGNEVSSVTYLTSSGKQWIHAFVRGKDAKLYNNFWDGAKWQWVGYGMPPTGAWLENPTAITFRDPVTGREQIYVFAPGSDGNFYLNYGDVSDRKWANLGKP